jgi:hypothetical protein
MMWFDFDWYSFGMVGDTQGKTEDGGIRVISFKFSLSPYLNVEFEIERELSQRLYYGFVMPWDDDKSRWRVLLMEGFND